VREDTHLGDMHVENVAVPVAVAVAVNQTPGAVLLVPQVPTPSRVAEDVDPVAVVPENSIAPIS
jgi:hypothetical protein